MIPETAISALISSNATPTYQTMTFVSILTKNSAKIGRLFSFINTIIFIFALI